MRTPVASVLLSVLNTSLSLAVFAGDGFPPAVQHAVERRKWPSVDVLHGIDLLRAGDGELGSAAAVAAAGGGVDHGCSVSVWFL